MKTLLLFERFGEGDTQFLVLEGDHRDLDGILLNGGAPKDFKGGHKRYEKLCNKLMGIVYMEDGQERSLEWLKEPTKDWDFFVHCGFIP
jgi:hypothetical protein